MYYIEVEFSGSIKNKGQKFKTYLKQKKLEELIGRYTLKYGSPLIESDDNLFHYEFYHKFQGGFVQADLYFQIAEDKKGTTTEPKEVAPELTSKNLKSLVDVGFLTKVS